MSPVSKDESVTRSRRSTSGTRSSRSIRKSLQFLNPTTWRKSIPPAKDLQFPDTPSQEQYEEIKKVMKSTICGTPPTSRKEKRYGRLFLEAPDVLVDLKFQHTQPSNGSIPGIPERISSLGPMVIDSRDTHQDDADSCETRVRLSRRSTAKFIPDSPIKPAQGLKRKRTMEFYIGKVVKTEKSPRKSFTEPRRKVLRIRVDNEPVKSLQCMSSRAPSEANSHTASPSQFEWPDDCF